MKHTIGFPTFDEHNRPVRVAEEEKSADELIREFNAERLSRQARAERKARLLPIVARLYAAGNLKYDMNGAVTAAMRLEDILNEHIDRQRNGST